jgi:hypothetical protein
LLRLGWGRGRSRASVDLEMRAEWLEGIQKAWHSSLPPPFA